MFTLLFAVLMILVFGRLFIWGLKAAWGLATIVCTVVLLPLILIGLVIGGLITVAFPLLLLIGIGVLIGSAAA